MEGSWDDEFNYRLREHTTLANIISNSSITRQQAHMIHSIHYKPKINYALHHTQFTSARCSDLQKPVVNALLPKMGFSRKTARAIVYGPHRLGGLEFIHLETEQFCLQLQYLVRSLLKSTLQTREYLHLVAAYQRYLGTEQQFFDQEPMKFYYKPTNSKLTFLWMKLHEFNLQITSSTLWTPASRFQDDKTIMDEVIQKQIELCGTVSAFSDKWSEHSENIPESTFASDITDLTNGLLFDDKIHGTTPRTTTEIYPAQERPSKDAFKDWKHTIYTSFVHGTNGYRYIGLPIPRAPSPTPSDFPDFQSYFRSQSDAIKGILGTRMEQYSDAELHSFAQSLSLCDEISIFGDGSVKDGRVAHATRVYASPTFLEPESFIENAAITSSDPTSITSLRSETSSTLGGLYLLHLLRMRFNVAITAPVKFYYDNKESLRWLETLTSFSSYADPMATDFDISAESKRISDLLNLNIHTEHVPAHQDDNIAYKDLPRPAQINVDMDHASETIRISDAPTPRIPVFESNKIAIVINNAVVTDKLGPRLRYHITSAPLKSYLLNKNKWSDSTYSKVDWVTLDTYLKTVPSGKLTNLIKLQHGWQQTASRNKLMYRSESSSIIYSVPTSQDTLRLFDHQVL